MIRPSYALTLARTRLQSKRGILFASIFVASLLFAALIACIIIFTGAEKSATNFIKKANNDHFLVKVNPAIPFEKIRFSADLTLEEVRAIKAFEKIYYDQLRAKYKALGIKYESANEIAALTPASWKPAILPEEQRVSVNWESPVIAAMMDERYNEYAKTATNKLTDLKAVGEKYGASGYYTTKPSQLPGLPNLILIQDGKEDFGNTERKVGNSSPYAHYTNAVHNGNYSFDDTILLQRYLLTNDATNLKGVPVVVSAQEAVALFGKSYEIGEEPKDEAQKVAWLKDIQTKMNGHVYQACYRNDAERTLLDKIQRDYADIKNNEGDKNYQKPSLMYEYPLTPCGDITVKSDTRTSAEKTAMAGEEDIQKKLGTYTMPAHRLFTFQIVGVVNAQPQIEYTSSIENYLKSLLTINNDSMSASIPLQMYDALPSSLKFDDIAQEQDEFTGALADDFATRVVEFSSIDNARAFMANETCPSLEMNCEKKFLASPFGSNYLILDEIGKLFAKVAAVAFPILLGLAALIIWFTVSRIMSENRQETAVYRAMGAKRQDIAAIYMTYILLVALRISVVSTMLGVIAAFFINQVYGQALTDVALSSFGIINNDLRFNLFDMSSLLLWIVVSLIFVISIIASIQPLVRNVYRSPIRDIREN